MMWKWGFSAVRRGRAGGNLFVRGSYRFGEGEAWRAQQEEQLTGPKQNIQQAPALQIAQILGLQANIQRLS